MTGALTAKVEAVERCLEDERAQETPRMRSRAVTTAAARTTTRNGALRQARTPGDQDPGRAGEAGEAVALGQRGGGDQGGQHDHGGGLEQLGGPGRERDPGAQQLAGQAERVSAGDRVAIPATTRELSFTVPS